MNRVCSIFSQILQLISRTGFDTAARKHKAERHARGFSSWGQFVAMLFCQPMEEVPFFGLSRQRIWVFWRRILHTCRHRTQLTVYLRMLNKPVPSVYGPTSDQTWDGADPTSL